MAKPLSFFKIIIILLFLALAAQGQQLQRVAIMGTEDDGEPPIKILEASYLTDKLREVAGKTLPKDRYGIMTQQSIVDRLGSEERAVKECREATCLADLGRKINADYIAQARIGRFGEDLTIKVELYRVASGHLIASFTEISKTVHGLLAVLEAKAPDLFKDLSVLAAPVEPIPAPAPVPTPAPAPVHFPAPVAAQPQLLPLVQQLRESSLPVGCVADFTQVLKEDGFSMGKFVKELPPAVAKVKVKLKSPFGKPKDDDKTDVGLTVGCIKSLPESPAEIQGLLKDVALKAGLDFVVEAVEDEVKKDKVEKKGVRFGERAGYSLQSGGDDITEVLDIGRAIFGAGLALNIPIVSIIKLDAGLGLYRRQLHNLGTETAVSIPVLLQFDNSFYFATGIQLDVPIEGSCRNSCEINRSSMDFGLIFGLGYKFVNFELDFKYVHGLTDLYSINYNGSSKYEEYENWLGQYCLGVSYFF
jgi:hypothetical protein